MYTKKQMIKSVSQLKAYKPTKKQILACKNYLEATESSRCMAERELAESMAPIVIYPKDITYIRHYEGSVEQILKLIAGMKAMEIDYALGFWD